jgi:hypothetical protein
MGGRSMRMFARLFSNSSNADRRLAEDIELLRKSPLLDPVWYRQTYPDLRAAPIDVARHYLEHGAAEGRNPGPKFDTNFYLKQNPDVAATGVNPLVHYLLHGATEGRNPQPQLLQEASRSEMVEVPKGANTIDVRDWQTNVVLSGPDQETHLERPIGVFVHLFYEGLAHEIAAYLARIDLPTNIYVTTDTSRKRERIA